MGRLTSATNPESGTVNYRYDQNGNLLTRQDARGRITTFGFDGLNRLAAKQYSDSSTAAVTYCYDGDTLSHTVIRGSPAVTVTWSCSGAPSSGLLKLRRTMVSVTGGSVTRYTEYDALGRIRASEQSTGGTTYTFPSYNYNLADGLTSVQYPSRRTLSYGFDSGGRVSSVTGSDGTSYATSIGYAPHRAIGGMTERGGSGYEETCFDARLRVKGVRVGTATTEWAVHQCKQHGPAEYRVHVRSERECTDTDDRTAGAELDGDVQRHGLRWGEPADVGGGRVQLEPGL